jgi:large subunit ribosomal protein L10
MPRPEKVQAVADIKERIETAEAVFVAEYAGLSMKEQQQLRRSLRASQSEFKVVKMTLARRAAEELGYDTFLDLLVGPTGLAFSHEDAAATAKALSDFATEHSRLVIKGGILGGAVLPPERVGALAKLEPREVLLGRIAGMLQAPLANLAGLFAAMPRNLASMLLQLREKKESGELPVADAAGEVSVEEAAAEPAVEEAAEETVEESAPEAAAEPAEEGAEEEAPVEEAAAEPADDEAVKETAEESAPEAEGDEPAAEAEEED